MSNSEILSWLSATVRKLDRVVRQLEAQQLAEQSWQSQQQQRQHAQQQSRHPQIVQSQQQHLTLVLDQLLPATQPLRADALEFIPLADAVHWPISVTPECSETKEEGDEVRDHKRNLDDEPVNPNIVIEQDHKLSLEDERAVFLTGPWNLLPSVGTWFSRPTTVNSMTKEAMNEFKPKPTYDEFITAYKRHDYPLCIDMIQRNPELNTGLRIITPLLLQERDEETRKAKVALREHEEHICNLDKRRQELLARASAAANNKHKRSLASTVLRDAETLAAEFQHDKTNLDQEVKVLRRTAVRMELARKALGELLEALSVGDLAAVLRADKILADVAPST